MNSYKVKCLSVCLKLSDADWRNVVHGYTRDISSEIRLGNPNLTWGDLIHIFLSSEHKKYWGTIKPRHLLRQECSRRTTRVFFPWLIPIPLAAGSCWRTCIQCCVMETAVQKGCKLPAMIPPPLKMSDHQLQSRDFFLLFIFSTIWEVSSILTPAFGLKISSADSAAQQNSTGEGKKGSTKVTVPQDGRGTEMGIRNSGSSGSTGGTCRAPRLAQLTQ